MAKFVHFLVILILTLASTAGGESKQVTAEGVATIGSDPAAARDKAIEDALRRSVEQAVGTMVESETAVENYQLLSDRIYSRSSGYVKNYQVISENTQGNLLRVTVSAEVSSDDLNSDLASIGLLHRRMKYPRVMVMIVEENVLNTAVYWNLYSVSTSQAEATVMQKLKAKGFNVVDPAYQRRIMPAGEAKQAWSGDYNIAGKLGTKLGAEIVIVGKAASTRSSNNIAGSDLLSVSSTVQASAVKAGTGEIIAQASGQATSAHINEVAGLQQSLQKACEKLSDDLISGILSTWQRESSGTRSLVVEIQDIATGELQKLTGAFEKIRGVNEVVVRSFSGGSADLNIQAKTDAQELSSSIDKVNFGGFRLVLLESSPDRLEYKVVH